jgi:hypothetical protein
MQLTQQTGLLKDLLRQQRDLEAQIATERARYISSDPVTLPFVLSGSASSTVSGNLSAVTTVSSNLLELPEVSLESSNLLGASVESGDLSGLTGNLSDSYHASGLEPCIFHLHR